MPRFVPVHLSPIRLREAAPSSRSADGARGGLVLADVSRSPKKVVLAPPGGAVGAALGVRHGEAKRATSGGLIVGVAPGEWILMDVPETDPSSVSLAGFATSDEWVSVVDVQHLYAALRLTGEDAAAMLEKVCAIDLADRAFPSGASATTSVAKTRTGIVRDDVEGGASYLLYCESTLGQNLFDSLVDAGGEFGIVAHARGE